jgi:ATP-dependent helicase HrpA
LLSLKDIYVDGAKAELFPDFIESAGERVFEVEYKFAPSEADDGVTLIIHRDELRQLDQLQLGWLVPGLVEQKVIALLKSLCKEVRRQIVPIPDTARAIVSRLDFGFGEFESQLAREVSRVAGCVVSASDFNVELLPIELRMNIRVVGDGGEVLGEGRDLDLLRREFSVGVLGGVLKGDDLKGGDLTWNRSGLTRWDFGELPESVLIDRGKTTIKMFPMLCGDSLCLADSREVAESVSRVGIVRLFYLLVKREIRSQLKWLPEVDNLQIYSQPICDFDFYNDVGKLVAARAFQIDDLPIPRSEGDYLLRVKSGELRLGVVLQEVAKLIVPLFSEFHGARLAIENVRGERTREACKEAKDSLMRLVGGGFLLGQWDMLREYPRFFKAVQIRFEKLRAGNNDVIDRENMRELAGYWQRYEERRESHNAAGIVDPQLQLFRWMIEEYRVSLFAQKIGTSIKVSPQRLEKQFEKIRKN